MKNKTNNNINAVTLILGLLLGLVVWSCSDDDDAGKLSISPQMLPTVSSIEPVSGIISTPVTITGTNYSTNLEDIRVEFDGVMAEVIASTKTTLTTSVPSGSTSGTVTVNIGNSVVQGGPTFSVPSPIVASYSTTSGIVGTVVTITGSNFSENSLNNAVWFNGTSATIEASTATTITTSVPTEATTGAIIVEVDGQEGIGNDFIIPEPTIDSFDPIIGETGAVVTITGTNFSTNLDDNEVTFNGVSATITSSTETTIVTSVPSGSSTGVISVSVGGQSVDSENDFTVTATTLIVAIDNGDDDVEEVAELAADPDPRVEVGTMSLGSSDLEMGEISSGEGLMNIGLRFNNMTIPSGAIITEASIQFNADDTGSDPVELTLYGESAGNSGAFNETLGNLSSRSLTSSNAVWSIPEWVDKGDRSDAQKTIDLSSILQEIIDRGDWESGNSISIIMKHTGVSVGTSSSSGGREAEDYSSSTPEHGAELTLKYTQ